MDVAGGSWWGRWIVLAAGAAVFLAGGVLWWNSGTGPLTRGLAATSSCDPTAPTLPLPAPAREDAAEHLVPVLPVPVGPVRATLCRYTTDSTGDPLGLTLDATRTAEVAGWLDVLPAGRETVPGCATEDVGTVDVVTFGYPEGADASVVIWQGSCVIASNGTLTATGDTALVDRLQEFWDAA
jgi:hypothetical protein